VAGLTLSLNAAGRFENSLCCTGLEWWRELMRAQKNNTNV